MQGRDTFVVFPTGGGKSLCYQIPALMREGLCLVVSPLISLMKDQVSELRKRGIKAVCFISGLTNTEQEIILNNCIHGKVKLLYVSPERLKQRFFIEHLRQMTVSAIAVDEAHCISQWGYDFRPSYLEIAAIRAYHPHAPIIALTATSTPVVAKDIREKLLFRDGHRIFHAPYRRENLTYMVFYEEDKMGRLLRIAHNVGGSGIIYVRNRRRTLEIAKLLIEKGIPAAYYHAGLELRERDLAQLRWMKNEVSVMVATNAFGMGIDKPDVRFVVHLDIPDSVEAYYQEAGRAGRDGQQAYAILLYNNSNKENLRHGFDIRFPSRKQIANTYRALCNYYQLPIGSGQDCQFDFDIESVCDTYNLNVLEFYNCTRFLEREGLIDLPQKEDTMSRIHIPIDREELYRFQVSQPRYSQLVTTLLRMYGGMFSDFVDISERNIARNLQSDEHTVRNMLLHIDALKMIVYKQKKEKPQIIFTSDRINADDLHLNDHNYKTLKEHAQLRMEAMLQYVTSTEGCRKSMLVKYFGENSAPCGKCDLCIEQKKKDNSATIQQQILNLLKEKPLRADELLLAIGNAYEKEILQVLHDLVDKRAVSINESLQFFV